MNFHNMAGEWSKIGVRNHNLLARVSETAWDDNFHEGRNPAKVFLVLSFDFVQFCWLWLVWTLRGRCDLVGFRYSMQSQVHADGRTQNMGLLVKRKFSIMSSAVIFGHTEPGQHIHTVYVCTMAVI